MSQSVPIRTPAYRLVFPPPAYCAYTGGAIPVPNLTDRRPATETHAYTKALVIPVNAPLAAPIHVEDVVPVVAVSASPYPPSLHRVLPDAGPIHVKDPVASVEPRRRGHRFTRPPVPS